IFGIVAVLLIVISWLPHETSLSLVTRRCVPEPRSARAIFHQNELFSFLVQVWDHHWPARLVVSVLLAWHQQSNSLVLLAVLLLHVLHVQQLPHGHDGNRHPDEAYELRLFRE